MTTLSPKELARYIDHTLLKPDATSADIQKLCLEARTHGAEILGPALGRPVTADQPA